MWVEAAELQLQAPDLRRMRLLAAGLLRARAVGMWPLMGLRGLLRVRVMVRSGMAEVRRRLWVPGLRLMGQAQGLCPAAAGHLCTIR